MVTFGRLKAGAFAIDWDQLHAEMHEIFEGPVEAQELANFEGDAFVLTTMLRRMHGQLRLDPEVESVRNYI